MWILMCIVIVASLFTVGGLMFHFSDLHASAKCSCEFDQSKYRLSNWNKKRYRSKKCLRWERINIVTGVLLIAMGFISTFGSIVFCNIKHNQVTEADLDCIEEVEVWSKEYPEMGFSIREALEDDFLSKSEYYGLRGEVEVIDRNRATHKVKTNVSLQVKK